MYFLSTFSNLDNVEFNSGRKKGAKDKKKRKPRIKAALLTLGALGAIGSIAAAPMIGGKIGGKLYLMKTKKQNLEKAKQLIQQGKEKVYGDTANELIGAGVEPTEALGYAQRAAKEYEDISDPKLFVDLNNYERERAIREGFKYGIYGQVGLTTGLVGSALYKANLRRLERKEKYLAKQNKK